jgi:aryl-alcohol dehydrogenase-like predicted oxidoreductase/enamine deaminase RidA (YjgF/YER057c/UK114 family)
METTIIGKGANAITIPRIVTGLWQLDQGADLRHANKSLSELTSAGLDAFDLADSESRGCSLLLTQVYGPAEDVLGLCRVDGKWNALTKWCPPTGTVGAEACAAALNKAVDRLGSVELLQYHIWRYEGAEYLENVHQLSALRDAGRFKQLGLTNVDIPHLDLLLGSGYEIASNQVHVSVLDIRGAEMGEYCAERGVAVLAYGTLLGGFVHPEWHGQGPPGPKALNASKLKYLRMIEAAGGWSVLQRLLDVLQAVADKHGSTIPLVAMRYVLDLPGISAVIVGSSLSTVRVGDARAVMALKLDDADRAQITAARDTGKRLPGGCGDELRYEPFLTPTGGRNPLSVIDPFPGVEEAAARGVRAEYMTGSAWEPVCGMCRAVRAGTRVLVSGTTTRPHPRGDGAVVGATAAQQATFIFDIIGGALTALGGSMRHVLRTRMLFADVHRDWEPVGAVQARVFAPYGIRPANTMVGGMSFVVGPKALIEIEAEAIVGASAESPETVRVGPLVSSLP